MTLLASLSPCSGRPLVLHGGSDDFESFFASSDTIQNIGIVIRIVQNLGWQIKVSCERRLTGSSDFSTFSKDFEGFFGLDSICPSDRGMVTTKRLLGF